MFPDLMRDDVFRLETGRLWLRWPRAADAARIAELASSREVAEQTTRIPHPYPPGAAAEFILDARRRNLAGEALILVLTLKSRPNEVIGAISLAGAGEEAELGFWLGQPYWGQGYMSEALAVLIKMVLALSDIETIRADVRLGHERSRDVLAGSGFVDLGSGVAAAPARGGQVPVTRFALTRASARRPGPALTEMYGATQMQLA